MIPKSVSNWKPSQPKGNRDSLLQPNAKDNKDTLTPENSLEQHSGKAVKPSGMLGKKGKMF
jgi:hypothetical protein